MKLTDFPLVAVLWNDAGSNERWVPLSEVLSDTDMECLSIGWLVQDTPYRLVLVASRTVSGDSEDVSGHVTIPKAMIKSVQKLTLKKKMTKKIDQNTNI